MQIVPLGDSLSEMSKTIIIFRQKYFKMSMSGWENQPTITGLHISAVWSCVTKTYLYNFDPL